MTRSIGETLVGAGTKRDDLQVSLSHELVALLSEQLYQSPLKAIEELVVNSFDADAGLCRIVVPETLAVDSIDVIAVYDDGIGMDEAGLEDLWHVGHSHKREELIEKQRQRSQIGKFGIGKLATYAIAHRITYVTKAASESILTTSLDFDAFKPDPTGGAKPIQLPVRALSKSEFENESDLLDLLKVAGVSIRGLAAKKTSWTVVLLERFKDKASELRLGRLKWVLATAMPLRSDFKLYVNKDRIESSKETFEKLVEFGVHELDKDRLRALGDRTEEKWHVKSKKLVAPSFPHGITGDVIVTRRSLMTGKSEDIERSHGFFVRVRDRLVNMEDPLFGLKPRSHQTFNRFRADLNADDLDEDLTAPREGVATTSRLRSDFEILLNELFLQARKQYEDRLDELAKKEHKKKEHERNWVNPTLVERPVADALSAGGPGSHDDLLDGADADDSWFYLRLPDATKLDELLPELYGDRREQKYTYERSQMGPTGRLVSFSPEEGLFRINEDHEVVRAHDEDAQPLLEDLVTAEALLEVYLRAEGMESAQIGEVLERRDQLLRSLARDRVYSLTSIAGELRDAKDDEFDLEATLVTACRALGFVAKQISGAEEPDGIARFIDPEGEQKMTLEAKSSQSVPSLNAIDFSGLKSHRDARGARGCLLVAPRYPGASKNENAQAARRARDDRISCWTVEQLAKVVESSEDRHIGARDVLEIVKTKFSPDQVAQAVSQLLSDPAWDQRQLYRAILNAIDDLQGRLADSPRTVEQIATEVSRDTESFRDVGVGEVRTAISQLAGASKGILILSKEDRLILGGSISELRNRTKGLTGAQGDGRRKGTFRQPANDD